MLGLAKNHACLAHLAMLLCTTLLAAMGAGVSASDPYYADPLFDAAHDAEFVWHEGEQAWWVIYLQVKQNNCTAYVVHH